MDCKAPEAKHGLAPPSPRGSATLDPITSRRWGMGGCASATLGNTVTGFWMTHRAVGLALNEKALLALLWIGSSLL